MSESWYAAGLRFECTGCGDCCRGEPGFVWVSFDEAERMAAHLGMGFREFEASFLRRVGRRMSLIEKDNGDCVFWESGVGCKVYRVRPVQCRNFPFWLPNIESQEAWRRARLRCPGMGHGRLYGADEIERLARESQ